MRCASRSGRFPGEYYAKGSDSGRPMDLLVVGIDQWLDVLAPISLLFSEMIPES